MNKVLRNYFSSSFVAITLFLSLDVSLLLSLASIALTFQEIPSIVLVGLAVVCLIPLPVLVSKFAHSYQVLCVEGVLVKESLSKCLKRAGLGVLYALALLVVFLAVCGAMGVLASIAILPSYGLQTSRDVIMLAAQVLAVLAIPIPVMICARYVFTQRRESPISALSSFRGITWFLLAAGSAFCFLLGWLLASIPANVVSGIVLVEIQLVTSWIIGTIWLMYCAIICASCAGSDCNIRPEAKLNIPHLECRVKKASTGALACVLSIALAICMVSTESLAYAKDSFDIQVLEIAKPDKGASATDTDADSSNALSDTASSATSTQGDQDDVNNSNNSSNQTGASDSAKGAVSHTQTSEKTGAIGDGNDTAQANMELPPEPVEPVEYYEIEEMEGIPVAIEDAATVYQIDDTHFTTVIGGQDTAYIDEAGDVQEIDNTLEPVATGGDAYYENAANSFTAHIPAQMDGATRGITIYTQEGTPIELIPLDGDFTTSVAKDEAIRFASVRKGIDYQYTLVGSVIKEDIVLNHPVEPQEFRTLLNLPEGLHAKLDNNNISILDNQGTEVAKYCAPELSDATGELGTPIELELNYENGFPVISIILDWEWLSSPERTYPVRIDPSLDVVKDQIRLNVVEQTWGNRVIGESTYYYVGYDDGISTGTGGFNGGLGHGICRIYAEINFDFSKIYDEATIDSATFSIYQGRHYSNGKTEFGVYRIKDKWNFNTLCWNNQVNIKSEFLDSQSARKSSYGYLDFDIHDAVLGWADGRYAQRGLCLKAVNERSQCEYFLGRDKTNGPKISINWSIPDPVGDDYSLEDTTAVVRPYTERNKNNGATFDGVSVDGLATPRSFVAWSLMPDDTGDVSYAFRSKKYPDSTDFQEKIAKANSYKDKLSNWQGGLITDLAKDKIYHFEAVPVLNGQQGKKAQSDTFLVYTVKKTDTLPSIASYYGVPLKTLSTDNRVQDMLAIPGDTLFIRNPKTAKAYNPKDFSVDQKKRIDSALMGRDYRCEYGFEPINMNTGNFVLEAQDATVPETEGAFELFRTYNSKTASIPSAFGRGWSYTWDESLSRLEDDSIAYNTSDGKLLVFEKTGDSYTCSENPDLSLKVVSAKDNPDTYTVSTRAGEVRSFNSWGLLSSITSPLGLITQIERNEDGQVTSVISPNGYAYSFEYGDLGLISKATLPDGSSVKYTYDEDARLTSVIDAVGGVVKYTYNSQGLMDAWYDADGNLVCQNTYDGQGRVTKQTDGRGSTSTLRYENGKTIATDAAGNTTTYAYDDAMCTTSITYPDGYVHEKAWDLLGNLVADDGWFYSYDLLGNRISETSPDGITTSYTYDDTCRLLQASYADGEVVDYAYSDTGDLLSVASNSGATTSYAYDAAHRVTSEVDADGVGYSYTYSGAWVTGITDGAGNTTSYVYDNMGRVISIADGAGNTISTTYDALGRVVAMTDGAGGTTTYTLSKAGLVQSIIDERGNTSRFGYDASGNMTVATDPAGGSYSFVYDVLGNQLSATNAAGDTTTYEYDTRGNVSVQTDAAGNTTSFAYDGKQNLISTTYANGATESVSYDATFDQVVSTTDVLGHTSSATYTSRGSIEREVDADGATRSYAYAPGQLLRESVDELGTTTTYSYTKAGRLSSIDKAGHVFSLAYDNAGNISQITDELGGIYTFTYDGAGRTISLSDPEGRTTHYVYDGAGRLTSLTDGEGNTTGYTYDAAGNLIATTDGNGNTTEYTYDVLEQLITITDALGSAQHFAYDKAGNLTEATDELGHTTRYSFDALGNLISQTDALGNTWAFAYDVMGNPISSTLPNGNTERATYDAAGNMLTLTDAAGLVFEFSYDAAGRQLTAKDSYGASESSVYDTAGNVVSATDSLGRRASYTYDAWGNLFQATDFDGAQTTYTYDAAGNLTSKTDALGATTSYNIDGSGNTTGITDALGNTTLYAYDKANRLVRVTDALDSTTSYTYDNVANVTSVIDEDGYKTNYAFDALNRLIGATDALGNTTIIAYDATSNIISIMRPEGDSSTFAYDALGRLIQTVDGVGATTQATYDALGNVVSTTDELGATAHYTYDAHGALTSETNALGATTTYKTDLHGNTTSLTRANGATYNYTYDVADRLTIVKTPLGYERSLTYDVAGNVERESDNLGRSQSYVNDALHNLLSIKDAKGGTTSYAYDALSQPVTSTDVTGATTQLAYDGLGRITQITDEAGGQTKATYDNRGNIVRLITPEGRLSSYAYDGASNLISATDGLNSTTKYTYDKNSRLISVEDANGRTQAQLAYDAADNITAITDALGATQRYAYDAAGNITSSTNALGNTTNYTYDILGQLVKTVLPGGQESSYTYDVVGNIESLTDALGNTTKFSYDAEDNLISKTSLAGLVETIEYDMASRVSDITDPAGNTTHYKYDELNEVVEKSYTGPKTEEAVLYTYDALGQTTARHDATGDYSYTYDTLGRITSEVDSAGNTLFYEYDGDGNLAKVIYPDGTQASYTYDDAGNLEQVNSPDGTYTYTYNKIGNPLSLIRPDGSATTYTYDDTNRIALLENKDAKGKIVSTYAYTYNEAGDIVQEQVVETGSDGSSLQAQRSYTYDANSRLTAFIEESDAGKFSREYTYDDAGSRTEEKRSDGTGAETISYTYDEDNRLIQAKSTVLGTMSYEYDAAGNLVSKQTDGQEEITYEYGVEQRLIAVREGGRLVMAATYDGDSNRIFQMSRHRTVAVDPEVKTLPKTSDTPTLIVFGIAMGAISALGLGSPASVASGANAVAALFFPLSPQNSSYPVSDKDVKAYANTALRNGWGTIPLSRIHVETDFESIAYVNSNIGEYAQVFSQSSSYTGASNHLYGLSRIASLSQESVTYYLNDGRGSTTAAVQGESITANYSWGAFGELLRGTYSESPFYGYDSEDYSPATGTLYLRARYLNVAEGGFGVEDSYLGNIFNPRSLNLYAYAHGNPVRYSDPSGHFINVRGIVNAAVGAASKAWNTAKTYAKKAVNALTNVATGFARSAARTVARTYSGFKQATNNVYKAVSSAARTNTQILSVVARAATSTLSQVAGLSYSAISSKVANAFKMPVYFDKKVATTNLYNAIQHGFCGTKKPVSFNNINNPADSRSTVTVTYNRNAAREYMAEYGIPKYSFVTGNNTVDKFFDFLDSKFKLNRNKNYYSYSQNCANFVSQVLEAGGAPQTEQWHSQSTPFFPSTYFGDKFFKEWDTTATWSLAANQYNYFSNIDNGYTSSQVINLNAQKIYKPTIISPTTPQTPINIEISDFDPFKYGVQTGDLMYFYDLAGNVSHATIISKVENGKIYYAGNTEYRFDHSLDQVLDAGELGVYIVRMSNEVPAF